MCKLEKLLEWGGRKRDILFLLISGIALIISIFDLIPLPFDTAWFAIVLCGLPIILEAVTGLVREFDIKADVLVSLALIASVIIGEDFAAGEVAFIMQLGSLLEELTVAKAREGIEKLVNLTPPIARKIVNNKEIITEPEKIIEGDILRVLPGETVPADGVIISGQTSINQAVMTGESMPVDKSEGDEVSSGTLNQFGAFEMKALKDGEDSSIQRMIKLVQSADAGKAKIVGIADRWATWIVVIALTAAVLTWLISGEIIRAVTILVVFCPCALVLATPAAIMAAIGNAAKHGFLVREGDALERLADVTDITFDKTGTLTYGKPHVEAVISFKEDISKEEIYTYAASSELQSEHPLGKAVISDYRKNVKGEIPQPKNFKMIPGRGVEAFVKEKNIIAGNTAFFKERNINISEEEKKEAECYLNKGCTLIFIAFDNETTGFIALADTIRENVKEMIEGIKMTGVNPVLLTGDNENAAKNISEQLKINEVHSECTPESKLNIIDKYQKAGRNICMIGDGVNDAPALKKAYAGIAMGGVGSDIAAEAADIVLVNDDIKELPHLLSLSKRMMITIKCNLTFSMVLNFIAIVFAITGILNPVVGALVHNCGSVIVIINSAFLLRWKKRK